MLYPIHVKGKILKTPQGNEFIVPTIALQKAIEQEWSSSKVFHYQDKPLTALVATALDKISPQRDKAVEECFRSLKGDLLLFWAPGPPDLYQLQQDKWLPFIDWFNQKFKLSLVPIIELEAIGDIEITIQLKEYLKNKDIFHLTGLSHCVHLTGSLILACAFWDGVVKVEEILQLVNLHEIFQQQTWGRDSERLKQEEVEMGKFEILWDFLKLLGLD